MKAIVLLSGGLDSATVLYQAKKQCEEVQAISFNYGQKHHFELGQAAMIAARANVKHHFITLNLPVLNSSLTDSNQTVEKNRQYTNATEIPATYVPGRNTMFLSIAASIAESLDYDCIYIGVNAVDYSGYPDCRPAFINAFNKLLRVNSKRAIGYRPLCIWAPIIFLTKVEIIKTAFVLGVPLNLTTSCYDPQGKEGEQIIHCGTCDSCRIRRQGFIDAHVADPTIYKGE